MAQLFSMILSLSVSGGLVGLLVLLFRPVSERIFSRRWTYYLWLLVLVRLLVPVHADINLMEYLSVRLAAVGSGPAEVGDTAEKAGENSQAKMAISVSDRVEEPGGEETRDAGGKDAAWVGGAERSDGGMNSRTGDDVRAHLLEFAAIIWILGVLLMVLRRICIYRRFVREIRAACEPVIDKRVLNKSLEVQTRLGIGRRVPLYESTVIDSPMLIGFWKPRIYLPQTLLSEMIGRENDVCLILHHEFVHYKRKDIFYKWLFQAALCVHWFNPFVYVFNRKFNVDCELACDETVMKLLSEEGRKAYGNVLLDVAQKRWSEDGIFGKGMAIHKNVPTMTLLEEKGTLKERLLGIAQYHKTGLAVGLCSVVVLVMFLATALVCGAADPGLLSTEEKTGFQDFVKNTWEQISDPVFDLAEPMQISKNGNAYRIYDDDALIAGDSESDVWRARNYCGGGGSVKVEKFALNGSDTLWILYANKETTLEISSAFHLRDGRFKLVWVKPDQSVQTLNESGEENIVNITLPEGRNAIKMVGQKARLEDIEISSGGAAKEDFDGIYVDENVEYAYQMLEGKRPLDLSKIEESYPYLKAEDVSRLFQKAWQEELVLSEENWEDLWIYSDERLTSQYLLEELQAGKIKEFNSHILCIVAPHMKKETVSECFRSLLEKSDVSESDWEEIFIYSDARKSAKYLAEALRRGDAGGFNDEALGQISYQVSTQSLTDIVTALDRDQLSFEGLMEYVIPFVQRQDEAMTCICHYIDLGNVLTDDQLREIEGYLSEEDFYRVVEHNGRQK